MELNKAKQIITNSLYSLYKGELDYTYKNKIYLNEIAIDLLMMGYPLPLEYENVLFDLIRICNITYNNTSRDILPIEDGIYDLLCEKFSAYKDKKPVGAPPIEFKNVSQSEDIANIESKKLICPISYLSQKDENKICDMLFPEIINSRKKLTRDDFLIQPIYYDYGDMGKIKREIAHEHPELVGTLNKCKFVLESQAREKGVDKEPNVKIFERDFLYPTSNKVYHHNDTIDLIASIKYDGVSVEADVLKEVISARTRGDTAEDKASDITHILKGYTFPNAPDLEKPIGMKFEAIITYDDLERYNAVRGYNFKNARTAIISIFGSSDGWKYRDFITLIPLETSITVDGEKIDRLIEIDFMNRYYCKRELFRYSILSGNYTSVLFQVKAFVDEAEYCRNFLPFMYDGVVFEYLDPEVRKMLGRENSINKYAMAVKFNPLKKQTIFRRLEFTVGQDGSITPIIYYDPIEFMGAIHDHSTLSSYDRFMKMGLREGNIIDVEYVNDVMPYVTKPDNSHNITIDENNPPIPFIDKCPSCGSDLVLSNSGKSMMCCNLECDERNIKRVTNMLSKLGITDFAEERIKMLGLLSFKQLMECSVDDLAIVGNTNKYKLYDQLQYLKNNPIEDYKIIGALGFTGIANKTWRLIFNEYRLEWLINEAKDHDKEDFIDFLTRIKGVGPITAETIWNEMQFFMGDMIYIYYNFHIINTIGSLNQKSFNIRFTGFRDTELVEYLNNIGCDADDNAGVTKNTDILLTPYDGYTQGNKYQKAIKYGIKVIPVNEFKKHIQTYTDLINEYGDV